MASATCKASLPPLWDVLETPGPRLQYWIYMRYSVVQIKSRCFELFTLFKSVLVFTLIIDWNVHHKLRLDCWTYRAWLWGIGFGPRTEPQSGWCIHSQSFPHRIRCCLRWSGEPLGTEQPEGVDTWTRTVLPLLSVYLPWTLSWWTVLSIDGPSLCFPVWADLTAAVPLADMLLLWEASLLGSVLSLDISDDGAASKSLWVSFKDRKHQVVQLLEEPLWCCSNSTTFEGTHEFRRNSSPCCLGSGLLVWELLLPLE